MHKKVQRVFTTTTFSSLVALMLLGAHPAAAVDGKTYPDSMCAPSSGEVTPFFCCTTANLDPNSAHFVNCPIVRDTVAAASGISAASITVRDLSPVEDVECTLFSLRPDGTIVASSSRKSSGVSSATQTLSFGGLSSVSRGYYTINCRIPRRNANDFSHIVSYQVDENE
jgi:hypothetical protein